MMTGGGVADRFRRAVEPAVRGAAGVVMAVAFFAAAAVVGGRGGVAIASAWVVVVAARTGRRALGQAAQHAQDR